MKTTTELMKIVSVGGNLIIDAKGKTTTELMKIVSVAAPLKVHVTIKNAGGKTITEIMKIASIGLTYVTFDFTA